MRYIIPYSFSQQNEFYKVYNTKQNKQKNQKPPTQGGGIQGNQKKEGGKKSQFHKTVDFTASVPLQKYLHKCKSVHHCLEYITITYRWQQSLKNFRAYR